MTINDSVRLAALKLIQRSCIREVSTYRAPTVLKTVGPNGGMEPGAKPPVSFDCSSGIAKRRLLTPRWDLVVLEFIPFLCNNALNNS